MPLLEYNQQCGPSNYVTYLVFISLINFDFVILYFYLIIYDITFFFIFIHFIYYRYSILFFEFFEGF